MRVRATFHRLAVFPSFRRFYTQFGNEKIFDSVDHSEFFISSISVHMLSIAERLQEFRDLLKTFNIDAYIIPTDDSHGSEYPPKSDARREYISGFTGSAGTAVITQNEALLWTDGR